MDENLGRKKYIKSFLIDSVSKNKQYDPDEPVFQDYLDKFIQLTDEKKRLDENNEKLKTESDETVLQEINEVIKKLDFNPQKQLEFEQLREFFKGIDGDKKKETKEEKELNSKEPLYDQFQESYQLAKEFIQKDKEKYNSIINNYLKLVNRAPYSPDSPKYVKYLKYSSEHF